MREVYNLPPQKLSFKKKTEAWAKKHLDWADSRSFHNYEPVRNSVQHKQINYDLLRGKLYMEDLERVLNPDNISASFVPTTIQHYPIINSKIAVLLGEEYRRVFDYQAVITNPNAISEKENNKKQEIMARIQNAVMNESSSEEEFNAEMERMQEFSQYEYQDMREVRVNAVLKHYSKEYNMPLMFNKGFIDALAVSEEMYQCDIVGGEPTIERINPLKIHLFMSGYSNRVEDADMIILEDYWSPAKIIDNYYEELEDKDVKYLEELTSNNLSDSDEMDNVDERRGLLNAHMIDDALYFTDKSELSPFTDNIDSLSSPFDSAGNVRVLRLYWKSKRKIRKVKSYDPQTGEEIYSFYPETYVIDKDRGEEEEIFWINEAWEGTKIGEEIYVNMRPRVIQYNKLGNPSKCHFGIIGSIYNLNDAAPFSFVDKMKSFNYLYDVIHDRLNRLLARNWGKIMQVDLAKKPSTWDFEKWMYYAKVNGIAVVDSFNEGKYGAATGKLAGGLNNNSTGVIDAELGNTIQGYINMLEFIKLEMSEVVGITRQREGNIENRETVGGIERATMQSSYITEWLFATHDDVKLRALECFIDTSKIAFKGRNKKFQYLLSDGSLGIMEIDGDEYAENDYGIVVDNGSNIQELKQKLDMLAQAALQNNLLNFSTIMKLYNSSSMAEKQRMVEINEKELLRRQEEAQQQQVQIKQQEMQQNAQIKEAEMLQEREMNAENNQTKIIVAQISAASKNDDGIKDIEYSDEAKANLMEKIREFNENLKLDKERLEFDKKKAETDASIKREQIRKRKWKD